MRPFQELLPLTLRPLKGKKTVGRPQVEVLEERRCPTSVIFAGFVPNTSILNINEMFSSNSPSPGGPGSTLIISGNTPAGGGATSMITVEGGFETTINGMNAATFTTAFPDAITAINVTMLNDNDNIVV